MTYRITTFYAFRALSVEEIEELRSELSKLGENDALCGLILIAAEGINGTVGGADGAIAALKSYLNSRFPGLIFKDSLSSGRPFKRYKVKVKEEIVALGDPALVPQNPVNNHLSPEEWDRALLEEDVLVLDVRNNYESALGRFRKAITPDIDKFNQFPQYLDEANLPKEKMVLMYCTGGIRCEKAILEMQRRGYRNVYQLEGGILKYLESRPNGTYEGECFVFDHRVAVDHNLRPSKRYRLCPHCGDPGDLRIVCRVCGEGAVICGECVREPALQACSKNCAYHLALRKEVRADIDPLL